MENEELKSRLRAVALGKTGTYTPRTRYLDANGQPQYINRLILEDSPYLLQHAHNPVDWFSWGEEAFAAARNQDRPVFLSIGYSTCHWCHVMEVESFDDENIAGLLNRHFICIKLDREQFPDIDDYYMTGVQLMSGQGGWPMSNFLLPDGRPFYGATYFPPAQFAELLNRIATLWSGQREELESGAAGVAQRIEQLLRGRQEKKPLLVEQSTNAVDRMQEREDRRYGGLAGAPKFPQEPLLYFFLESAQRSRDIDKAGFVDRALSAMACGGIYDQLGGGFHRYSTDAHWLVPHFEKMLYNQSQLSLLYLRAWLLTGRRFYLRVMGQTLDYVLRELQLPEGGFYSATDADSEEQEGLFFIWPYAELTALLEKDDLDLITRLYHPTEAGNFEGANILALEKPLDNSPEGRSFSDFEKRLDSVIAKLLAVREQRIPPLRDDKLIVAWSAAMANSLAWAGWETGENRYVEAAERAVRRIWQTNYPGRQKLQRIFLNGEVSIPAQLEDYANLCEACITLFDVTENREYLDYAVQLAADMRAAFWNEKSGGFYLGPEHRNGPRLARSQSASDGATLSAYGTAVMCLALLDERLGSGVNESTVEPMEFGEVFRQAIDAVSGELEAFPPSHVTLLRAILYQTEGPVRPIRYGAGGRLRIATRMPKQHTVADDNERAGLLLSLSTVPGYHVTQQAGNNLDFKPLRCELLPEERHWTLDKLRVSEPEPSGSGQDANQAGERLEITLYCRRNEKVPPDLLSGTVGIRLSVQVCSDSVCLAPESFSFRLPAIAG